MLTDILPAKVRKFVYALFGLAVVIQGCLAAGGVDTGKATDVLTYLGGALGLVAASNTATAKADADERGVSDMGLILAVVLLVFLLVVLEGRL